MISPSSASKVSRTGFRFTAFVSRHFNSLANTLCSAPHSNPFSEHVEQGSPISSYSHYQINRDRCIYVPFVSIVDIASIGVSPFYHTYCYPSKWDVNWDDEFYSIRDSMIRANLRFVGNEGTIMVAFGGLLTSSRTALDGDSETIRNWRSPPIGLDWPKGSRRSRG